MKFTQLFHRHANLPGDVHAEVMTTADASSQLQVPEIFEREPTAPNAAPNSRRRQPILFAIAGLGAIVAGGFGYHTWQYATTHETTDDATVIGHIHPISSRVSGRVQQVLVKDNQWVNQGQLLVKLDPRDQQIALQQAETDLAAAQLKAETAKINIAAAAKTAQATTTQAQGSIGNADATIASAQAQVSQAQAGIPQAQAQLDQANANLQKARLDYNRDAQLFQQGAIARADLDAARQAYQVALAQTQAAQDGVQQAQAKLAQARQAVSSAQAGLQNSQGDLQGAQAKDIQTQASQSDYATAEAAIAQAQVELRNAQLQLSYTSITAPTAGRVGNKSVEVGQQVQPGMALMAVVSPQHWVVANFKETQLDRMRPGEQAEVKLDAFPSKTFIGQIDSLSPASGADFALLPPDNATGNYTKIVQRIPVKIGLDPQSIEGYESLITAGMSATVTVDLH